MSSNDTNKLPKTIRMLFFLSVSAMAFSPDLFAQQSKIDSLNKILMQNNLPDSIRINCLNELAVFSAVIISTKRGDSLFNQALALARDSKNVYGEIRALIGLSNLRHEKENFSASKQLLSEAMQLAQKHQKLYLVTNAVCDFDRNYFMYPGADYIEELKYALDYLLLAEQYKIQPLVADACTQVSALLSNLGDDANALSYQNRALSILNQFDGISSMIGVKTLFYSGENYRHQKQYDKAINTYKQGYDLASKLNSIYAAELQTNLAFVYVEQKRYKEAFTLAFNTLSAFRERGSGSLSFVQIILAKAYLDTHRLDSALFYGKRGFELAQEDEEEDLVMYGHWVLSKIYDAKKDFKAAYYHYQLFTRYSDSLYSRAKTQQAAYLQFAPQLSRKENEIKLLEKEKELKSAEARKQRVLFYSLLAGTLLVLALFIGLVKNYRSKQRANILLQEQKEQIQKTLEELKTTQAQLIQSEKMASLGELTAGIAHEIQNPLNFVNNFSEINKELLEELTQANGQGRISEVDAIAKEIIENEDKITHHGKRADNIVKGMLQHARASTGTKEPVELNKLADEYLRISYQGMRVKDKTFHATLETNFDKGVSIVHVLPQDLGRVLLNLYNNAFYAVNIKKLQLNGTFEPTVEVSTKRVGDNVEITVRDNGTGMPQKVVDKIFQPFFTTKPTGQGTGLGLSLSYDIIKAHGGEIKVETEEGEGTTFIIQLLLQN